MKGVGEYAGLFVEQVGCVVWWNLGDRVSNVDGDLADGFVSDRLGGVDLDRLHCGFPLVFCLSGRRPCCGLVGGRLCLRGCPASREYEASALALRLASAPNHSRHPVANMKPPRWL